MAEFLELQGVDRVVGRLDDERWSRGLHAGLTEVGEHLVTAARANLAERTYTGRAAASVQAKVEGAGIGLELRVGADAAAAPEAAVLERGRRAGSRLPPRDVIATWLEATGGDPGLAFPVARSIAMRGIKPIHWLSRALEQVRPEIRSRLASGIDEATR